MQHDKGVIANALRASVGCDWVVSGLSSCTRMSDGCGASPEVCLDLLCSTNDVLCISTHKAGWHIEGLRQLNRTKHALRHDIVAASGSAYHARANGALLVRQHSPFD